jgi:hypothetical protein
MKKQGNLSIFALQTTSYEKNLHFHDPDLSDSFLYVR